MAVDRGRIPQGGAVMNGLFLAGTPRFAEQGVKISPSAALPSSLVTQPVKTFSVISLSLEGRGRLRIWLLEASLLGI
jgi:hypothetical protein